MVDTNLGKTDSEIIYKLLLSINRGGAQNGRLSPRDCVWGAKYQYEEMVDLGIIVETKD